jgi:hypothetical protein
MNGQGKSDRPVVPLKSPNKAGRPAAEAMEGRGLAKGNLPEQNALRTQSRMSVHSALERVRQAAKKDRTMRFTALLHHVYSLDTLRTAYSSAGSLLRACVIPILYDALASLPEARAGCGNAARPDLWRGLWVTIIPTPTGSQLARCRLL